VKVLAFAASSSVKSINKQLVAYATSLLSTEHQVEILDLNDFELPLFSVDTEASLGSPKAAQEFFKHLGNADAILISFAEHNGSYTAAYKNLFDWVSRIDQKVFQNKPMVLLATSPGKGGAKNVLNSASTSIPHFGGQLKGSLSVPQFYQNFDSELAKITNPAIEQELQSILVSLG
jgi:NAD(P)H-dependent FMN reductase